MFVCTLCEVHLMMMGINDSFDVAVSIQSNGVSQAFIFICTWGLYIQGMALFIYSLSEVSGNSQQCY